MTPARARLSEAELINLAAEHAYTIVYEILNVALPSISESSRHGIARGVKWQLKRKLEARVDLHEAEKEE